MASIRHIDVHRFLLTHGHKPTAYDYVSVVGGNFKECSPPCGRLFLVTDVKVKGVETVSRGGTKSWDWRPNEIFTKWGMARPGQLIAEGSLQFDNRDELLERLLKEKRVLEVGKYDPVGYNLKSWFVTEIENGSMKADREADDRLCGRGPQPKPGEPKPHPKNTISLEVVRRYSPITPGLEVFRVMLGQMLTSRHGVLYENDLFTGLMISQTHADEMLPSILAQKIAEKVGSFQRSENEWDNGKLKLVYDRGREPEISEGWGD